MKRNSKQKCLSMCKSMIAYKKNAIIIKLLLCKKKKNKKNVDFLFRGIYSLPREIVAID